MLRAFFAGVLRAGRRSYAKGHFRGSVNVPVRNFSKMAASLAPLKGRYLAVAGTRGKQVAELAELLVSEGFPKVCVLKGGVDALHAHLGHLWVE